MSTYSTCSEWAAAQRPGDPHAKLLLILLALDIDDGHTGATHARLTQRSNMRLDDSWAAVQFLEAKGFIENIGVDRDHAVYAPRGWQA